MQTNRRTLLRTAVLLGLTVPLMGWAQAYPNKLLRVVVPYPAGSSLDVVARLFTEAYPKQLKQTAIVVNQPGASGSIGTRAVAQAAPDGYTILLGTNQTHGANTALFPNLNYDAVKDFTPIARIGRLQHILVVRKDLGVNTLDEFIALARKPDSKLNYGSSGPGSASHLAAEMFKQATGADMMHIPYNGSGQAAQALMGGHIDATFTTLPSVQGFIKTGGMLALAVASKDRAPQLPELPTLAEQGVLNSEADAWTGLLAPAGTPPEVIDILSKFTVELFSTPEYREKLDASGFVPDVIGGEAFTRFIDEDMQRWAGVVKSANIALE